MTTPARLRSCSLPILLLLAASGPPANRTVLAGYATVDGGLGYSRKIAERNWTFGLHVGNALARDYRNGNGVPQPLRTFSFTTSVKM